MNCLPESPDSLIQPLHVGEDLVDCPERNPKTPRRVELPNRHRSVKKLEMSKHEEPSSRTLRNSIWLEGHPANSISQHQCVTRSSKPSRSPQTPRISSQSRTTAISYSKMVLTETSFASVSPMAHSRRSAWPPILESYLQLPVFSTCFSLHL